MIKLAVVIPTFNRRDLSVEAIDSVLSQELPDVVTLEVVVVDDCSPDDTVIVLKQKYGEKITLLVQEVNQGVSAARNRGVLETDCDLYCFLDADDLMLPGGLSYRLRPFIDNPDFQGGVYGGSYIGDEVAYPLDQFSSGDVLSSYVTRSFLNVSSFVFPRQLFVDLGGFNTELTNMEDVLLIMRMMARVPFMPVAEFVSRIRKQEDSASRNYGRIVKQDVKFLECLVGDSVLVDKLGDKINLVKRKVYHELLTAMYKGKDFKSFCRTFKMEDVQKDSNFTSSKWKRRYFIARIRSVFH